VSQSLVAVLALLLPLAVHADTALRFEVPSVLGGTSARVVDESGKRIGKAQFETEQLTSGGIHLSAITRLDSGAGSETEAVLAPAERSAQLKLVSEHSQSFAAGHQLVLEARIDHVARRAECGGSASDGGSLALDAGARVANTPVQLLLRPLATTSQREIEALVVVCRGAPHLMTMRGERKGTAAWPGRPRVVEVEYGPTGLLGALASLMAPRISFWFDPSQAAPWIAHRMPLEPGGASVIVVREGVALASSVLKSAAR
jgi:hypothetical protein